VPQQPSNQICFHEDFRHGLLGPAFRLQLQSVIYLDVTVTYGLASSQCMELGHHRVAWKFFPDKLDEFS